MENSSYILREWAPMTDLLNKIPTKAQSGLFTKEIFLTCVDVLPEFLALGSNVGLVYWYNRKNGDLRRLRCENTNAEITCVKIISTVDYMVACGNTNGQISIFQIPKSHPDSLPENLKPKSIKQVERYTVADLHNSTVTSIEWAKNGMKLFSGDKNGVIVLTELDFYMHICKSVEILNESYEIVQLSYCQHYLLVSTTYRSIICQKDEGKWKVCQVGKKDRKVLGKFGGIFCKNGLKPTDILAYCNRPGLRIWISDLAGAVQQTLLFRDLISKECMEVPLLNPIGGNIKRLKPQKELSFGQLQQFDEKYLVTYDSESVYILDPIDLLVVAMVRHVRSVLSLAINKNEIFILEGQRSLIRISYTPEPILSESTSHSIPTASTFLPITNSIKDITTKLQSTSIISAIPTFLEHNTTITECAIQTDVTSIINAEEAIELSPVKELVNNISTALTKNGDRDTLDIEQQNGNYDFGYLKSNGITGSKSNGTKSTSNSHTFPNVLNNSMLGIEDEKKRYVSRFESPKHIPYISDDMKFRNSEESLRKLELYEKIGEQSFEDDILFKHCRKKKQYKKNSGTVNSEMNTSGISSNNSDCECNDRNVITKPCILNLSTVGLKTDISIEPDLRSPDSIQNDIKHKEKLLSDILNFDKIQTEPEKIDPPSPPPSPLPLPFEIKPYNVIRKTHITEKTDYDSEDDMYGYKNTPVASKSDSAPVCPVPNSWMVNHLTLNQDQSDASDGSLTDWEIV